MTDTSLWQTAPLTATIDHILERYHHTHRRQLNEILPLAEKVSRVHAGHVPASLLPLLQHLQDELESQSASYFRSSNKATAAKRLCLSAS